MSMTRRERLTAIFEGRTPDRPAVKLWGASPGRVVRHPAFAPVLEHALEKTDLMFSAASAFNMYCGARSEGVYERATRDSDSPEWLEAETVMHTPDGDLSEICFQSKQGRPGYHKTYFLKEPGDIRKLLSLLYERIPFSTDGYRAMDREVGQGGVVLLSLDHAMYALERMIGSENFALWSLEADGLILEAITVFAARLREHVEAAFDAGLTPIFAWVGPELCIPPLMSPTAFDRYVAAFDAPLIERIHERGGHAWVHSHGKMGPVLTRFADMGIDVLNPIEPPPMGDIALAQAFEIVGDRMALEGNIETHDFMTGTVAGLRPKIHDCLRTGNGRRFILCPSSGFMENVDPGEQEIENWLFYIDEGVRVADSLCG